MLVGLIAGFTLRSMLVDRARHDLTAEFERRADPALAGMAVEVDRYAERIRIVTSFAGLMDRLTSPSWQRFVKDTGILELDSNNAVAYVEFVPPSRFETFRAGEIADGASAETPLVLPDRLGGSEDLYIVSRLALARPGALGPIPLSDLGSLPSARAVLDRVRATGTMQTFGYRAAVTDALRLDLRARAAGLDLRGASARLMKLLAPNAGSVSDLGYGLAVPVRAGGDGPVVAIVIAGTLPIDGVRRIDATMGGDLRLSLSAQHGSDDLMYFHGEPPAEGEELTRSVGGRIGGIEWRSTVSATPEFHALLDTSGADVSALVIVGLAVLAASLVVVRARLGRRAELAAALAAEAEERAGTDALTGLHNRVGLERAMAALAIGEGHRLVVVFVDLDGLKRVNDSIGHDAGDVLIRAAAERLRWSVPRSDLVARLGGDEFVVVSAGDPTGVDRLMSAVLAAFAEPVPGLDVPVEASIGVAFAATADELTDAISRADAAMYRAKEAGGNRWVADGTPVGGSDAAVVPTHPGSAPVRLHR